MKILNYDDIQEIEMIATEKLLKYISKEAKGEDLIESLQFFYPNFEEYKHKLAFNMWLSLDYEDDQGKTYLEKFLDKKDKRLSREERKILENRKDSRMSLFEIIKKEGELLTVRDLLLNQEHVLWEPELLSIWPEEDLIFSRLANLIDYKAFIGDINFLPKSVKSEFMEEVLIDLNLSRVGDSYLIMEDYLKRHSANLYKIYTNSIFEAIEMEEDIDNIVYDELDEFESYSLLKESSILIKEDMSNLIDFFEYYLADEELTLYDFDQLDLSSFFDLAINDGFIVSHQDLNSYISTFKKYLHFLSNKNKKYKDVYGEILGISESRFYYMNKLKFIKSPFSVDKSLASSLSNYLNEDAISIIMDFDRFILYLFDSPLSLTDKNKFIKRRNLLEINSLLDSETHIEKKSPSQKDFPNIDLFYNLSLDLGMTSIVNNKLSITPKGTNYLRLRDEDKYSLFFQHIWNNKFIIAISNLENNKLIESIKISLANLLADLEEDRNYEISTIISKFSTYAKFFFDYYLYLQYLGIIKYSLYPNYELKVTPLGKKLMTLLLERNNKEDGCPVIYLENYKRS